ncbi:MAG TPA: GNAT family protein [Planctomycetota bacterium]
MQLTRLVDTAADLRLESPRLVLRKLGEADIATAIAHEQDRRIMRWIRDPQPVEEIGARSRSLAGPWQGFDGQWLALAVVPRPAGVPDGQQQMIGIVVCRVTVAANQTMEIGYRLQVDAHRRGLGTEACTLLFDHLIGEIGVRKLVAYCVAENEASWRLLEKLGMQREALLREYTFLDGQWRDEFVYGLLAREWRTPAAGAPIH